METCPHCGEACWANSNQDKYGPCSGIISVVQDYPDSYNHFCESHGPLDDFDWSKNRKQNLQ